MHGHKQSVRADLGPVHNVLLRLWPPNCANLPWDLAFHAGEHVRAEISSNIPEMHHCVQSLATHIVMEVSVDDVAVPAPFHFSCSIYTFLT